MNKHLGIILGSLVYFPALQAMDSTQVVAKGPNTIVELKKQIQRHQVVIKTTTKQLEKNTKTLAKLKSKKAKLKKITNLEDTITRLQNIQEYYNGEIYKLKTELRENHQTEYSDLYDNPRKMVNSCCCCLNICNQNK